MTTLMICTPDVGEGPTEKTMFGGRPSAPLNAFEWPKCRSCGGNMQFLGQIQASAGQLLLLFMCQNDPGSCEEWDPDQGGNRVIRYRQPICSLFRRPPVEIPCARRAMALRWFKSVNKTTTKRERNGLLLVVELPQRC